MKEPKDKRTKEYKKWKAQQSTMKEVVGLGDVIDVITTKTGIKKAVKLFSNGKDCGCDDRKKKWNKIKLFSTKFKPVRCLTEKEYNDWKEFKKIRTLKISLDQVKFISKLYSEVFGRQYYEPCSSCSPKPLIHMIERLDVVYDNY